MPHHDDAMILVLNAGSSSIKFALFDAGAQPLPRTPLWEGAIDDIGGGTHDGQRGAKAGKGGEKNGAKGGDKNGGKGGDKDQSGPGASSPHHAALEQIRDRVRRHLGARPLAAVAHRVVHGGTKYIAPTRIDASVLADLRSYIPLAPLHQPFALDAIEIFLQHTPDVPQIACFDTGFHHTMPEVETLLALPHAISESGVRRFGFHGLSYEYQSIALAERYGELAQGRVVVAHLGSGASLCGMHGLRSVATTMGFSALDGLMMGTRCGSLDAGALLYLMEVRKLTPQQLGEMLYHDSGLLGVSGLCADSRVLLDKEATDARAARALALYCRRFVHEFGALVAALGGIDMLVFTAGVGEHSAEMRRRLCAPLAFFGIEIDPDANAGIGNGAAAPDAARPSAARPSAARPSAARPSAARPNAARPNAARPNAARPISSPASRVRVVVEPTNEEWIAARHAQSLLAT
ncbi:MAG: acetate/propionate family kinase [Janthinobacterium lividum]